MEPGASITCSMCGHTFNSSALAACTSCPLHRGCNLVCCPYCGFETVDVNRSKLAHWVTAIMDKSERLRRGGL